MPHRCILSLVTLLLCCHAYAQTDTVITGRNGEKYLSQVSSKAVALEDKLDKKSQKILKAFAKEEERLNKKLAQKDSSAAAAMLERSKQEYAAFYQKLESASTRTNYIPSLDTLTTSMKFLSANPQLLALTKNAPDKLKAALSSVNGLQSQFRKAEDIKDFLRERKQLLKEQFEKVGLGKELKQLNKQAYYYSAQVKEYKELLKDHKKAEKKALELLSKTEAFKNFMRKNSMLASLFRVPAADDPSSQASLAGLQTRAQVSGLIQQQIAAGGPNAQAQFSQNMQQAQNKLNELKDKMSKFGGGSDLDMPEGFKPNTQKTKNFLQRIEIGTSIQSQKSNGFFPVTSDLALTAGYKLNDKSVIGVGAGYKMGWGRNIQHIKITHEGVSLRSFIDVKLKGSFWLTGGYEMNYRSGFKNIDELKDRSGWQESGLIGLSKVIDVRSKLLKKTRIQLLWDLLSYRNYPRTQPILFRVGYTLTQ